MKPVYIRSESGPHEWLQIDRSRGTSAPTNLQDVTPLEYDTIRFLGQSQVHEHLGGPVKGFCVGMLPLEKGSKGKGVRLLITNGTQLWKVPVWTNTAPLEMGEKGLKRFDQELRSKFEGPKLPYDKFMVLRKKLMSHINKDYVPSNQPPVRG